MKYISLGLGAPNPNYWLATNFRERLGQWADGKYIGSAKVMGYYTLIRPYPDQIDTIIIGLHKPKLLKCTNAI